MGGAVIGETDRATTQAPGAPSPSGSRLESPDVAPATVVIIDVVDVVPDWERLRGELDRVSRSLVRMRQRLVAPVLPITAARWVTDPDFDLDYHVRRVSLPEPGTFRQLLDLAETLHATPLDPNRPRWEATLVEGLHQPEDVAAAIVWKFSGTVPDGVGGMAFERALWATGREPDPSPMPPIPSPEDLSSIDLTRRELRRLPLTGVRLVAGRTTDAVRLVVDTARSPVAAVGQLAHAMSSFVPGARRPPVPGSPLLRRRGLRRRIEVVDVEFAALRDAASSVDCSLNDAYVAAVCGGLRLYHEQLGVPVDAVPFAISIPIGAGAEPAVDGWPGVQVPAPIGEADPVARMRRVRELLLTSPDEPPADPFHAMGPIVSWLPDQIRAAHGGAGDQPGIDVNVGSLGGHIGPVYVAGARVVSVVPVGRLVGAAVTTLLCSNDDRCHVGVHLDVAAVAEPARLLDCLRQGFDEVVGVARPRSRRRSR